MRPNEKESAAQTCPTLKKEYHTAAIKSSMTLQKQSHEDRLRGSVSAIQRMGSHIQHGSCLFLFGGLLRLFCRGFLRRHYSSPPSSFRWLGNKMWTNDAAEPRSTTIAGHLIRRGHP